MIFGFCATLVNLVTYKLFNMLLGVEFYLISNGIAWFTSVVFAFICKFMDYSLKKETVFYKTLFRFLGYVIVLVKEIIKANFSVVQIVLSRTEISEPILVKFRTTLQSELARVILANSITLTPGTITVSLEGDELTVHCLDKTLADGMEDSIFVKMLEKMEKDWNGEEK